MKAEKGVKQAIEGYDSSDLGIFTVQNRRIALI